MPDNRFLIYAAVYVLLIRDGKIFLLRRAGTGWLDGQYNLPAGHIEQGEQASQAAVREVKEEAGVDIKTNDLQLVHIMHRLSPQTDGLPDRIYADFFFAVSRWQGNPKVTEFDKSDAGGWFDLTNLPENLVDYLKTALNSYQKGIFYSEFGWQNEPADIKF